MASKHLKLAVRYANASGVSELSLKAREMTASLGGDIEHIRETMLAGGVGVAGDLGALVDIVNQLKAAEKLLERCEKEARKISREVREQLTAGE